MGLGGIMFERQQIVDALVEKLKPLSFVQAMWEAGSASFNRVDRYSDLDLMLVVDATWSPYFIAIG